jgi:hypothetical protein
MINLNYTLKNPNLNQPMSCYCLMFKINYIKKHNEMEVGKKGNKMWESSNFLSKKSCKLFKAKQIVKNLIINGHWVI